MKKKKGGGGELDMDEMILASSEFFEALLLDEAARGGIRQHVPALGRRPKDRLSRDFDLHPARMIRLTR